MKKRLFTALFFLSVSLATVYAQSECENAGYVCSFHSCPQHQEIVRGLECASPSDFCCKDIVYPGRESKVYTEKESYEKGDEIKVMIQLPSFRDCSFFITSPSGIEKGTGSGGCGPTGMAESFTGTYLEMIFGKIESGEYKIRILAEKAGEEAIEVATSFFIKLSLPALQSECIVKDNLGVCEFLGTSYKFEKKGCNEDIDLKISYNGKDELFLSISQLSKISLKDGTEIRINGAPCAVPILNLVFDKKIKSECNNDICEVGEDASTCENDCGNPVDLPQVEKPYPNLRCSTGCIYNTNCLAFGIRVNQKYCSIENELKNQKTKGEICENNFECENNLCIDGQCIESGLFKKFLNWFKNFF